MFEPRPQDHLDFRRKTGAHLSRITWGVLVADHTESRASWLPRCFNCVFALGYLSGGCLSLLLVVLGGVCLTQHEAFWSNMSDSQFHRLTLALQVGFFFSSDIIS